MSVGAWPARSLVSSAPARLQTGWEGTTRRYYRQRFGVPCDQYRGASHISVNGSGVLLAVLSQPSLAILIHLIRTIDENTSNRDPAKPSGTLAG